MSPVNEFGGSMSFKASVDESAMRLSHPSSLLIQLDDESEWLEEKVGGFKEVIVRYHGKEHRFTPDEVLQAQRREIGGPMINSEGFAEAMDSARRYADAQPFVPLGVGMMLKPMLDRLQAAHDQELEKAYEHGKREMER